TRSIMAYRELPPTHTTAPKSTAATREERRKIEFASRGRSTAGKLVKITFVVITIVMLSIPMFFPSNSSWISSADIPPAIANGGTGYRLQSNDWLDAMNWISKNTEPDAVIASWWDYGYWITTLGNRTSLADNATLNQTRIATIAKMFMSDEQSGVKIAQDLKADYIVVYVVGQERFTAQVNATNGTAGTQSLPIYTLGQGGDESKKQWFMRIGGFDEKEFIESDGFTPTPQFWNDTLIGKLFPFEPLYYARFGPEGPAQVQKTWEPGFVGLYAPNIKYPASGGNDQPLQLVYASPSFENQQGLVSGVFVYKVNHDYVPKPLGNPYAPHTQNTTITNTTNSTVQ
ncbi:MAG TPA: hypothetical protein VGE97_06660, partial [Nitrososphaera sp.]